MKKQKECHKIGCTLKGYWREIDDVTDEVLFCFRTQHNGENHAKKMSVDEIIDLVGVEFMREKIKAAS